MTTTASFKIELIEGGTPAMTVPSPWSWEGKPKPCLSTSVYDPARQGIITGTLIEGIGRWFVVPKGGSATVSRHAEGVGGARDDAREYGRRIPLWEHISIPAGTLFRVDRVGSSDRTAITTVLWGVQLDRQLSDQESAELNGLLAGQPELVSDFLLDCGASARSRVAESTT
jgi:hypothetical protein